MVEYWTAEMEISDYTISATTSIETIRGQQIFVLDVDMEPRLDDAATAAFFAPILRHNPNFLLPQAPTGCANRTESTEPSRLSLDPAEEWYHMSYGT